MKNPWEVSDCLQRSVLLYQTPDFSAQPNLLLVYYRLISSSSWVRICFSEVEVKKKKKRQNGKCKEATVIFDTWIWYHLLTWLLKSVSNLFVSWIFMLWITSPFVVKLSDVAPLRKPPCQSNICSKILSCSELPCFQKAVTLFTPAENLSQEILQGQALIGQRTKCHPRGAIAMKTLTGVSPDVLEACCFPKPQNRTLLFCSAEYYFAINFICFPLYQKCWCFWIFIFFFTACVFRKQSVGRDFTSLSIQSWPTCALEMCAAVEPYSKGVSHVGLGQYHVQRCLSLPELLGCLVS